MADSKVSDLTAVASVDGDELLYVVDDPAGTPADRKVTVDNLTARHAAAADPHTGYQKESEKDAANGYAGLDGSGLVPDARIAATIARDSEVTSAVSTHEAAADPHTGYVLESLADAKGDLFTATGDNTPARKAVGSDGQFLKADSAQGTGLVWAALADADIPAAIARDSEVTTAVSNHEAAADPHTGYLKESDVNAKGDLFVATANDTVTRLAVGSNNQVLTADSAQTEGVKWATPSASGASFATQIVFGG